MLSAYSKHKNVKVTRSAAVTYSVTRGMLCGWTERVRSTADQGPVTGPDSVLLAVRRHGMKLEVNASNLHLCAMYNYRCSEMKTPKCLHWMV